MHYLTELQVNVSEFMDYIWGVWGGGVIVFPLVVR